MPIAAFVAAGFEHSVAIAVAHHEPYDAQAASSHWQDLSDKVIRAARAGGPAFLNVLTNCPLGWGHEPRDAIGILNAGVDSCYWPLYEVVEGAYRLTYEPTCKLPVEEWLRPQKRFAHLFADGASGVLSEIQQQVDDDWAELRAKCRT
jgi:pyruvate ferredoxin oxidoreductase beta subunit